MLVLPRKLIVPSQQTFCSNNAITYKNSPPYHPQSNGWAERAVRTVKGSLKKMVTDSKTKSLPLALKVDAFLFKYRNTPVTTTNECPNALIFSFRPRTLMSVMNNAAKQRPNTDISTRKTKQHTTHIGNTVKIPFKVNDLVVYKAVGPQTMKWIRAKVVEVLSVCRYKIKLMPNGTIRVCHGDQIRKFNSRIEPDIFPNQTLTRKAVEKVKTDKQSEESSEIETESNSDELASSEDNSSAGPTSA